MRFLLSFFIIIGLSACATSTPFTGPNGELMYALNCSGSEWSDCYKKASNICGSNGYIIQNQQTTTAGVGVVREMVIQCKDTIVEIAPTE